MEKQEAIVKLEAITSGHSDRWKGRVAERQTKQAFSEMSRTTAINILSSLREKGMTQKDLAAVLEVTPQTVNQWVKGTENFTFDTVGKIAKALGVQPFELVRPIDVIKWRMQGVYSPYSVEIRNEDFSEPAKGEREVIQLNSMRTLLYEYSN